MFHFSLIHFLFPGKRSVSRTTGLLLLLTNKNNSTADKQQSFSSQVVEDEQPDWCDEQRTAERSCGYTSRRERTDGMTLRRADERVLSARAHEWLWITFATGHVQLSHHARLRLSVTNLSLSFSRDRLWLHARYGQRKQLGDWAQRRLRLSDSCARRFRTSCWWVS